jgi:hypothetical protein
MGLGSEAVVVIVAGDERAAAEASDRVLDYAIDFLMSSTP